MREILFKGKRLNNGEWVEGFYSRVTKNYNNENAHYITCFKDLANCETILTEMFDVDPETVCQYTGLKDKNGKKIFEGDIVKVKFRDGRIGSLEKEYNYVVRYYGLQASFELEGNDELLGHPCLVQENQHTFEVVGTIFDSRKLLEVTE